jgi:hypothetical protein
MPRRPGSPNRARRIEHQPLRYKKRVWHYDGRLYAADHQLHITKIHGPLTDPAALNEAIRAECARLRVTVHLDDERAAGVISGAVRLAMPWEIQ